MTSLILLHLTYLWTQGLLPQGWAETLCSASLAFLVPLLLAGLGECLVERSGIINIGLEGMMLTAAFAAVAGSHATGSAWLGLACGAGAALAMGAGFGCLTVYRNADQVVAGTAINILALGVTGAAFAAVSNRLAAAGISHLSGVKLPDWSVPGLSALPVVGPTLFHSNVLVYAAFLLVPAMAVLLGRSRWGLYVRAAGEHPRAAEAAGLRVRRLRLVCVCAGAVLAGLAGCFLAIGHVNSFGENMTAGKGFIALALVIFGRWRPWGVLAGAAVFSLAWGAGAVLSTQGRGSPAEVFLLAIPYLATLAALVLQPGRAAAPAALAQPFAAA